MNTPTLRQIAEEVIQFTEKWFLPSLNEFDLNKYKQQKAEYLKRYDQKQLFLPNRELYEGAAQVNKTVGIEDDLENFSVDGYLETIQVLELQIKHLNRENGFLKFRIGELEKALKVLRDEKK